MSVNDFQRHAHCTPVAAWITTLSTAPRRRAQGLRSQKRLEAELKLEEKLYAANTNRSSFRFSANRGPTVRVELVGRKPQYGALKRAIPVFEEGTVDDDLLNEGNRRLRD